MPSTELSPRHVLWFGFSCSDKTLTKNNTGEENFIWVLLPHYGPSPWTAWQELKAGSKAKNMEDGAYWLVFCFWSPRFTCRGAGIAHRGLGAHALISNQENAPTDILNVLTNGGSS